MFTAWHFGGTYLRLGKIRCKIGETISEPYFACAAKIKACLCVASNTGASEGGSARRFDSNFATWLGFRSAWSKDGC